MSYKRITEPEWYAEEWRDDSGLLHREDGPAYQEYDADTGTLVFESFWIHGKRHRVGGPALREIDSQTGVETRELYCVNGKLHREDGPAEIIRNDDGSVSHQMYYVEGKLSALTSKNPLLS